MPSTHGVPQESGVGNGSPLPLRPALRVGSNDTASGSEELGSGVMKGMI